MTHRLLLIDDDLEDRETVLWALESFGIEAVIREAPDTQCGARFLEQETFDCVLLDFHLPDGTGLELLNRIAHASDQDRPPIILMTGRGDEKLAVEAMKLGACDYLVKGKTSPEQLVGAIGSAIDNATQKREQSDAQDKMKKMALYDPLTGLANRYLFEETLDHAITLSQRSDSHVCVLWMDLDGFKQINDTLGHHAGDLTLQEVGRRLNALTRNADTVSRLGGDEFVIIMESGVSDGGANTVAQKISDAMKSPIEIDGQTVIVGISIGIGVYPRDGKTRKAVLEYADAAMYRAKSGGSALH